MRFLLKVYNELEGLGLTGVHYVLEGIKLLMILDSNTEENFIWNNVAQER